MTRERQLPPLHSEPEGRSAHRDPGRLNDLVQQAQLATSEAQPRIAREVNELLIHLRQPGNEKAEADAVKKLLDSHALDDLVDSDGRSCRREAVETLVACGFPWALEVSPEDLAFARLERTPEVAPAHPREPEFQGRARLVAVAMALASLAQLAALVAWGQTLGEPVSCFTQTLFSLVMCIHGWGRARNAPPMTTEEKYGPKARFWLAFRGILAITFGLVVMLGGGKLVLLTSVLWAGAALALAKTFEVPKPR